MEDEPEETELRGCRKWKNSKGFGRRRAQIFVFSPHNVGKDEEFVAGKSYKFNFTLLLIAAVPSPCKQYKSNFL